jgi:hypothetical protein
MPLEVITAINDNTTAVPNLEKEATLTQLMLDCILYDNRACNFMLRQYFLNVK